MLPGVSSAGLMLHIWPQEAEGQEGQEWAQYRNIEIDQQTQYDLFFEQGKLKKNTKNKMANKKFATKRSLSNKSHSPFC